MTLKIRLTRLLLISIITISMSFKANTAWSSGKSEGNQWIVTVRTGASWLLREVSQDLVMLDNEFTHSPGLALDLGISRTLGSSWEPGINFSVYRLSGKSELPEFSANGFHPSFVALYQAPVEYVAVCTSLSAFCRYYLRDISGNSTRSLRLNPYAELGAGMNYFFSQTGYQNIPEGESSAMIFGKGTGEKPRPGPGNVGQVSIGLGTKLEMPQNMTLIFSVNADIINYDCLDAVHNYTDGERNHAKSIVPKIMLGVCIPIGSQSRSGGDSHLPWSR